MQNGHDLRLRRSRYSSLRMFLSARWAPCAAACLCFLAVACGDFPARPDEIIASAGNVPIFRRDLLLRSGVTAAYGGDSLPPHTALAAALNDALAAQVAADLDLTPTDKEIAQFLRHADETTRAPEILQRVKEVFGNDSAALIRIYLMPKITEAKLQRYQAFDSAIQSAAREGITRAYSLAAAGRSFAEAARETGGTAGIDTFRTNEEAPPTPRIPGRQGMTDEAERPLAALARTRLKPGVLFSQVVEDPYAYRIVRMVDRNAERSIVEVLSLPKLPYDAWLQSRAEQIPVAVHDADLANSVRAEHGRLWWTRKMTVEQ